MNTLFIIYKKKKTLFQIFLTFETKFLYENVFFLSEKKNPKEESTFLTSLLLKKGETDKWHFQFIKDQRKEKEHLQ